MSDTIFSILSLDRAVIHWEDFLAVPTPIENHAGVWFKREDFFAPLGYGGPNGSKLRQLIYLFTKGREGKTTVLSGASVKSPQLSMSTIVGRHFGMDTEIVIGATTPESAIKHPNIAIASGFGARFYIVKVGYNPYLQSTVAKLQRDDTFVVEYGITLEHSKHSAEDVRNFHMLGAQQVRNIPREVETLIMPAGSCNSLVSVIVGLILYNRSIKKLRTLGIGPDKMDWVLSRVKYMGYDIEELEIEWEHTNLHDLGFCDYGMEIPFSWDNNSITFHPTYEGKMMKWLDSNEPIPKDDKHLVWIVGSKPDVKVVEPYFVNSNMEKVEVIDG